MTKELDLYMEPLPDRPLPEARKTIFNQSPKETIEYATEIANTLKEVILKQGLSLLIQGKQHVRVEGWLTLGTLLGITPVEEWVHELPDFSYEAKVNLVNQKGVVIAGASALCGIDERRWKSAEKYARRSMAITRATAKAYRLAFGWVMALAGYDATPAEEVVVDVIDHSLYQGFPSQKVRLKVIFEKHNVSQETMKYLSDSFFGKQMNLLEQLTIEHLNSQRGDDGQRSEV